MEANSLPEIIIRAEISEDAADIVEIRNQPLVRWGTLALPYTSLSQYVQRRDKRADSDLFLVACINGRPVGMAGLNRLTNPRCAHTGQLGIMVHDAHHGRGVGRALMAALLDAADNWLNLKRLELQVYTDNRRAIALYQRFGFVTEGTHLANAFREGVYVDSHVMARVRLNP
jgi:L-phenylalanine/L-methionine N-acetyltransferase